MINFYYFPDCKSEDVVSAFWKGDFYTVPIIHDNSTSPYQTHMTVDGQTLTVIIDSGADTTTLSQNDFDDAILSDEALDNDKSFFTKGVHQIKVKTWLHHFHTMEVGPFHFRNPAIAINEANASLLGADFLRTHRVWLPGHGHVMYVQPIKAKKIFFTSP